MPQAPGYREVGRIGRVPATVSASCCDREMDTSQGTWELRITPVSPSLDRVKVFDFKTPNVKMMQ